MTTDERINHNRLQSINIGDTIRIVKHYKGNTTSSQYIVTDTNYEDYYATLQVKDLVFGSTKWLNRKHLEDTELYVNRTTRNITRK